jgi:hypothetical protein
VPRYMKQIKKYIQKNGAEGGSALNPLLCSHGTQVSPDTSRMGLPTGAFPLHIVLNWVGPHPSIEGRGTVGLELHGGEQDGQKGGDGGGGIWRMNQHQPLMGLMLDSNSAFRHNNHAWSWHRRSQLKK